MKQGMNSETGALITGIPYLRQRLSDVINTPLGSLVGRREFGSRMYQMVDHNVDSRFQMDGYIRLAEAIASPFNGLDDFQLKQMSLVRVSDNHIEIWLSGEYLPNGEPIELDGIDLYGRN